MHINLTLTIMRKKNDDNAFRLNFYRSQIISTRRSEFRPYFSKSDGNVRYSGLYPFIP